MNVFKELKPLVKEKYTKIKEKLKRKNDKNVCCNKCKK